MTIADEIADLHRVGFLKSPFLMCGKFTESKRFQAWPEEKRYLYLERVGMIDGEGPRISPVAHVIACAQIKEPPHKPYEQWRHDQGL